jgi:RHS repeat-associated protein
VQAGQQTIVDYTRGAVPTSPSYRYAFGSYIDEPILRHSGTATIIPASGTDLLYYHRNQQYSITGLTDAAGNLVERYSYTAHGELGIFDPAGTILASSAYSNRYSYTGREWDDATRIYYFRARWLDPASGAFIGRDPLGQFGGMNHYRANLGLKSCDPTGLIAEDMTEDQAKKVVKRILQNSMGIAKNLRGNGPYDDTNCDACARNVLNFLSVAEWGKNAEKLFKDLAWTIVDGLIPLEGIYQKLGYQFIKFAIKRIMDGTLTLKQLEKEVYDALKKVIINKIPEEALQEQARKLAKFLFDLVQPGESTEGLNLVIVHDKKGELEALCTFVVTGVTQGGKDSWWKARGSCSFSCQHGNENQCCSCGTHLMFTVNATGKFDNNDGWEWADLDKDDLIVSCIEQKQ